MTAELRQYLLITKAKQHIYIHLRPLSILFLDRFFFPWGIGDMFFLWDWWRHRQYWDLLLLGAQVSFLDNQIFLNQRFFSLVSGLLLFLLQFIFCLFLPSTIPKNKIIHQIIQKNLLFARDCAKKRDNWHEVKAAVYSHNEWDRDDELFRDGTFDTTHSSCTNRTISWVRKNIFLSESIIDFASNTESYTRFQSHKR